MSHYHPSQPGQYPAPTPPPAKKKMPTWAKITAAFALPLFAIGGCTGAMLAGSGPAQQAADSAPVISQTPPTASSTPTATAPVKPKPVEQAPPRVPEDGTLLVGKDVAPGTYQTRIPAKKFISSCYWARLRDTDDSIDSIIDNDLKTSAGALMTLKVRATDYAVEVNCGGAQWTRVGS